MTDPLLAPALTWSGYLRRRVQARPGLAAWLAQAARAVVGGHLAREANHGRLAGRIGGAAGKAAQAEDRCHIDDGCAAWPGVLRLHECTAQAHERAQIDVQVAIDVRVAALVQRLGGADAGIVDQQIGRTEMLATRLHQQVGRVGLLYVDGRAVQGRRVARQCGGVGQPLRITVRRQNRCPFIEQTQGDGATDAGTCPGDDCRAVLQALGG